jgi:hypothetical protein
MPSKLPVLLVLLLLSGLLLAAAGAQGAPAKAAATASALEEDFEGLEEEPEEEESEDETVEAECETAREEADEGELGIAEVDEICAEVTTAGKRTKKGAGSGSVAPEECRLRSARAHAAVNAAGNQLKLTIGYTTYAPVGATVEVRKGSRRIATKSLRLGRSGVLRIVKNLGKTEAPKQVVVHLAVPNSPGFCNKYETEKVPVR